MQTNKKSFLGTNIYLHTCLLLRTLLSSIRTKGGIAILQACQPLIWLLFKTPFNYSPELRAQPLFKNKNEKSIVHLSFAL